MDMNSRLPSQMDIMKLITRCYYTNMDYLTPPGMHSGLNVPVSKVFKNSIR